MKTISKFKFKTQLYIYFLSIIMFLILSIMVLFYFVLKNTFYTKEMLTLKNQTKQISMNLENKFNYYYYYLELFSQNEMLKNKLGNQDTSKTTIEYFNDMTDEFCDFNAGKVKEIEIYKYKDYNPKLEKGDLVFTGTYLNDKNEKIFSIKKQVIAAKTNQRYIIDMKLYETEIYSLFNEDKSENSVIISQGNKEVLSISNRSLWNSLLYKNKRVHMDDITGNQEIEITQTCQHEWQVMIRTNSHYLKSGFKEIIRILISLIFLIVFIVVFLVSYITKQLNLRLKFLQEKIASIGSQDFYKNVKTEGEDEFSALSEEVDNARIQIYKLLEEIREVNAKERTSNMIALRAQINSHFLFNALASIKWMARQENARGRVAEAIDRLAVFLRYSIAIDENLVLVRREIEQLNAYIYLQKIRSGDDLNVMIDIEEEVMENKTVKLILQPFLENAFFHGRRSDNSVLNIMIYSYYDEKYYYLVVEDDGRGIPQKKIEELLSGRIESRQGGYGVKNVISRIDICTRGEGKVEIESQENVYTKITICQKR